MYGSIVKCNLDVHACTKQNGLVAVLRIAAALCIALPCTLLCSHPVFYASDQNKGFSLSKNNLELSLQQTFPVTLFTWFYYWQLTRVQLWMWVNVTQFPGKASSKCLSLQGDNKHSSTH